MNSFKRYDNFFIRELMRVEFKIHLRENNIKNLISFSNNNDDYLFYNTFSLSFIARDRKRVIN